MPLVANEAERQQKILAELPLDGKHVAAKVRRAVRVIEKGVGR